MESGLEPELIAFLKENPDFELNSYGRIHCKLTNHDFAATMSEVEKYIKTKKYLHAKNWYNYDYSKYEPYIVPHRSDPKKLFCIVTMTSLNKIPEVVERVVNSKKFKRLCEEYKQRKEEKEKREAKRKEKKKAAENGEDEELDIDEMLGVSSSGGEEESENQNSDIDEEGEDESEDEVDSNDDDESEEAESSDGSESEEEVPKPAPTRKRMGGRMPASKKYLIIDTEGDRIVIFTLANHILTYF